MRAGIAMVAILTACSRSGGGPDAGSEAGSTAPSSTSTSESAPAPVTRGDAGRTHARRDAGLAMEARRSSVARAAAEPALAGHVELIKKQLGGVMPAAIGMQATELTDARRRAVLLGAERRDGTLESPMVLLVDDQNALLWSKERPAAGIKPPVTAIAIASGPEGRFAIAVCDPPTSTVALRLWDDDGSPFADFSALETKTCDALSLLYWPTHGWVIVAAGPTETRAQLVTDAGGMAWGPGKVLGARWRTTAPVTLAADTASSLILVQYSQSPGVDRDADHALAFRYDAAGAPLWPSPVDLGAVRRIAPGQERITLNRTSDGVLRATLGSGQVELRSNGETRHIP
ncbi:MAG TPA: hypothetical protein VLT33_29285 [Labilithrix sp.]|nr:hypothetical protein [Labilithrix sp.]